MADAYGLGIDLGTSSTSAAIWRDGRVEIVNLGNRAAAIPSVLLLRPDGTLLTGEVAKRRGQSEPGRSAAEFKRRVGDPVPVLVGGTPYSAEALMAKLLRWVVDLVTEREGRAPTSIVVTHPANWGEYKLDLLRGALRAADVAPFRFLPEPEAAARHYASQSRVPDGAVIAVYDLGGGTFDASVLRKTEGAGFEAMGQPEGIERLGGIDVDEAVLGFVRHSMPEAFAGLDPDDPAAVAAMTRLRDECVAAKEQLSGDVDASIPVVLPGVTADVRLTRSELEDLIRPVLADTVACLERALRSAGVSAADLHTVLLVGGSSRIPLIAQLVTSSLGRGVSIDADPTQAVALGAALASAADVPAAAPPAEPPAPAPGWPAATEPEPEPAPEPPAPPLEPGPPPEPPSLLPPGPPPTPAARRRGLVIVAAIVVVLAVIGAAVLLSGGDEDPGGETATDESTTTSEAPDETTTTTTEFTFPDDDFVHITDVTVVDDVFQITFDTNYTLNPSPFEGPERHIHFFWNDVEAATAGTNGEPEPCNCWFAYGGGSPVRDPIFAIADRPEGATAICALVATPETHQIADVDGDGEPDPDSGDCFPILD